MWPVAELRVMPTPRIGPLGLVHEPRPLRTAKRLMAGPDGQRRAADELRYA
jgi:hypothetical protein